MMAETYAGFATRADFADWAKSTELLHGAVVGTGGFTYRETRATCIPDLPRLSPLGCACPDHWSGKGE